MADPERKTPPGRPSLKKLPGSKEKKPSPSMEKAPRKKPLGINSKAEKPGIRPKTDLPLTKPQIEPKEPQKPVKETPSSGRVAKPTDAQPPAVNPNDPDLPQNPLEVLSKNPLAQFILGSEVRLRGRRPKLAQLPREVWGKVVALIQIGATKHQAAKAFKICVNTFNAWLERGALDIERNRHTVYAEFFNVISHAEGVARTLTEIRVNQSNPEFWLRNGPGKTRQGEPGWTDTQKIEADVQVEHSGTIEERRTAKLVIDTGTEEGRETVAQALAHLQELGLLQTTEQGKRLLPSVIDVESKPVSPNGKPNKSTNGKAGNSTNGKH